MSKRRHIALAAVGVMLLSVTSFAGRTEAAHGSVIESKIFTNSEGVGANGLRIFFFDEVEVLSVRGCGPTFGRVEITHGGDRVALKSAAHTIPDGRPVVCTFRFRAGGGGGIDHWFWTQNGVLRGTENGGCDTPDCDEYLS